MPDRDHGVSRSPGLELRIRALSMLLHSYDEVRREVGYLRWHQGDADALAPSPYTRLGSRSHGSDDIDDDVDADGGDVTEPAVPVPVRDCDAFTS